jgi:hypothetical protein
MLFYVVKLLPGKNACCRRYIILSDIKTLHLSDGNFVPTCEVPTFSQVVITRVDGKVGSKLKMWGWGRETL